MMLQTQSSQTMKKMKLQYLRSLLFDLFEILQAVIVLDLNKGILLDFKLWCYGNQNQKNCLLLEKQSLLFIKSVFKK